MSVERGVTHPNSGWDSVSHGAPDLRHFPGVEGVKNLTGGAKYLVEEVWRAIRTKFPSSPVSQPDYPLDLRGHEKLFTDYGISLIGVESKKDGMTVFDTGHGELVIDWDKRVIKPPLSHYSPQFP